MVGRESHEVRINGRNPPVSPRSCQLTKKRAFGYRQLEGAQRTCIILVRGKFLIRGLNSKVTHNNSLSLLINYFYDESVLGAQD